MTHTAQRIVAQLHAVARGSFMATFRRRVATSTVQNRIVTRTKNPYKLFNKDGSISVLDIPAEGDPLGIITKLVEQVNAYEPCVMQINVLRYGFRLIYFAPGTPEQEQARQAFLQNFLDENGFGLEAAA